MTLDLAIREALAQGVTGAEISQMVAERIADVPEPGRTDVAVAPNTTSGTEEAAEPGQDKSARLLAGTARRVESAADIVGYLDAVENAPQDVKDVTYKPDELPEGLIDLPSASDIYRKRLGTLREWVRRGTLTRMGRMKGAAPGGYVVVSIRELEDRLANPPKLGRPYRKRVDRT